MIVNGDVSRIHFSYFDGRHPVVASIIEVYERGNRETTHLKMK